MKLVVSSILMLCPRQLPPSAEEATNFHLKFVAYQRRSKQWQTKSYLLSQTKIVNEPGDSAKNLGPPFSSLESPATTPRFWRHFPISTSSAPPTSWRQRVPETSEGVISAQESSCCVFIKVALPASFSLFSSFWRLSVNMLIRLDSNRGPLVSEATPLPTEPQPLCF